MGRARAIKPAGAKDWGLLPQIPTGDRKHLKLLAHELNAAWVAQGAGECIKWGEETLWAIGGGCSRETFQIEGHPYAFKLCKECALHGTYGGVPDPKCQNKTERYASRRLRRRGLPVIPHVLGVYGADICVNIMHFYTGVPGGEWQGGQDPHEEYWRQRLEANNLIDVWYDNILRLDNGRHVVVDLGCDEEMYYKDL